MSPRSYQPLPAARSTPSSSPIPIATIALASRMASMLSAPLWFGGPHRLSRPLRRFERNPIRGSCDWDTVPDRTLMDGEVITAGDIELTVHATPGHCANHLAFGLTGTDILLSGDHIMGWNSTPGQRTRWLDGRLSGLAGKGHRPTLSALCPRPWRPHR
ncbi:hypothetical protein N8D56_23155 [Devosia sp. A8/3-2]|nr:hypothetical protein N8D56_23155 [Devosia sp. A8/3-2]